MKSPFSYRLVGSTGCEICDQDGNVVAWTVKEAWAAVIVALLTKAEVSLNPDPCPSLEQWIAVG